MSVSKLFDLSGKVAVVTGGSRGIGEAIATVYAEAGAAVVLAGRSREPLDEAAARLRAAGASAVAVPTNCGHPEEVERLIETAKEAFGGVDILVNNAATNPHFGPVLEASDEEWRKTLDVNLLGYVHAARCSAAAMAERGGGKIVNVSSIAATETVLGLGVYGVSKAAVSALTRTLALELARRNIQVNALAPGIIKTRFSRVLWKRSEVASAALEKIPAGRFGETADLVGSALYLASSASDYTTGLVVTVDGGYSVA